MSALPIGVAKVHSVRLTQRKSNVFVFMGDWAVSASPQPCDRSTSSSSAETFFTLRSPPLLKKLTWRSCGSISCQATAAWRSLANTSIRFLSIKMRRVRSSPSLQLEGRIDVADVQGLTALARSDGEALFPSSSHSTLMPYSLAVGASSTTSSSMVSPLIPSSIREWCRF